MSVLSGAQFIFLTWRRFRQPKYKTAMVLRLVKNFQHMEWRLTVHRKRATC